MMIGKTYVQIYHMCVGKPGARWRRQEIER